MAEKTFGVKFTTIVTDNFENKVKMRQLLQEKKHREWMCSASVEFSSDRFGAKYNSE